MCSSPQLFAACHVLLRLAAPRHPPWTLTSLDHIILLIPSLVDSKPLHTKYKIQSKSFKSVKNQIGGKGIRTPDTRLAKPVL